MPSDKPQTTREQTAKEHVREAERLVSNLRVMFQGIRDDLNRSIERLVDMEAELINYRSEL